MADSSSVGLLRGLYDYHWWANHRLFGPVRALGEETARREVGKQFSFPTLKGMFAHLYAADFIWLSRWQGVPTGRLMGDGDFATLAELRSRWDRLEGEQKAFVEGLTPADLDRVVSYKNTEGKALAPGQSFSFPTVKALCRHIYGADFLCFSAGRRSRRSGGFGTVIFRRWPPCGRRGTSLRRSRRCSSTR